MKAEHFSDERRKIRAEWEKTEGICWSDFLYLFSGMVEDKIGNIFILY